MKNNSGNILKYYLDLSKLKIMIPVSLTGFTGYFIFDPHLSLNIILVTTGILLLAISASVLNQIQEAGLDRKMNMFADVVSLGHRLDDLRGHVPGVGGGEPDPLDPGNFADGLDQIGKIRTAVPCLSVGVHILAQEGYLSDALSCQRFDLAEDLRQRPTLLSPP